MLSLHTSLALLGPFELVFELLLYASPITITLCVAVLMSWLFTHRQAARHQVVDLDSWLWLLAPLWPTVLIVALGAVFWETKYESLALALLGVVAVAQVALSIWLISRRLHRRLFTAAVMVLELWISFAASIVTQMAITGNWL